MPTDWTDLSAMKTRNAYNAEITDRHHGATAPLEALPCRCDSPWLDADDGEFRCWKCGARPTDAAAGRS